jgi:hypothetical protein
MAQLSVVGGAMRYEFWMQVRRRSVWVVVALLSLLSFSLWLYGFARGQSEIEPGASPTPAVVHWAQFMAIFVPIGVGLVVADRLPRDRRLHVDEVLDALPGPLGARLIGKYAGSTLATLIPVVVCYAICIAYILASIRNAQTIPIALAAFAAIMLPGLVFVAAFSVACPAVFKVPLYQFLFTGYWCWANLMTPHIGLPSPTFTLLNAAGPWESEGFFDVHWFFFPSNATAGQAVANIALLGGLGALALAAAWRYLLWQRARA